MPPFSITAITIETCVNSGYLPGVAVERTELQDTGESESRISALAVANPMLVICSTIIKADYTTPGLSKIQPPEKHHPVDIALPLKG